MMISELNLTDHARQRMSQRGIGIEDINLITLNGTEVESGYIFCDKDYQAIDQKLKKLRDQAKKLVGKRVVLIGQDIVTAYHATRDEQRRLLRYAEDRARKH